jgi:hypothetical protein
MGKKNEKKKNVKKKKDLRFGKSPIPPYTTLSDPQANALDNSGKFSPKVEYLRLK